MPRNSDTDFSLLCIPIRVAYYLHFCIGHCCKHDACQKTIGLQSAPSVIPYIRS